MYVHDSNSGAFQYVWENNVERGFENLEQLFLPPLQNRQAKICEIYFFALHIIKMVVDIVSRLFLLCNKKISITEEEDRFGGRPQAAVNNDE